MASVKSKRSAEQKKAARASSRAKTAPATKAASKAKVASNAGSVAAYVNRIPEPARKTFDQLRASVRAASPRQAIEIISYGIPAARHGGVTVWYAAFSKHCSLFPGASVIPKFKNELQGYKISKGTIQFRVGEPLPKSLIRRIVKARFAPAVGKK